MALAAVLTGVGPILIGLTWAAFGILVLAGRTAGPEGSRPEPAVQA
jgi:hypothetical protein